MIVGELQKNHLQINDMHSRLYQEMQENEPLKNKIKALEQESDVLDIFDEVRNVIDDRQVLIQEYEQNLRAQKATMIAEYSHIDIEENIIEFF